MKGPYGFEMSENCQTCKLRKSSFFCQLSPKATKDFDAIKSSSAYPESAILFLEKQESRGVFVLCEGEVKLSISSSEGKTLDPQDSQAGRNSWLDGCAFRQTIRSVGRNSPSIADRLCSS